MARREYQQPSVFKQEGPRPYWYIRFRVRELNPVTRMFVRKEKRHSLGFCDEMTECEAKRERDRVMGEVNDQVYYLSHQMLFSDFVALYKQQHLPNLALGPRKKYESLLKNHILPAFAGRRLCDIGTTTVQQFLNDKAAAGLSWWTRNDLKGIVQGIYTKASDMGYWKDKNPALKTTLGRMQPKRRKYRLTDEQVCTLINELPDPAKTAVALTVSTGMRASEVSGLRWDSVDFRTGWIHISESFYRGEAGTGKTDKSDRYVQAGELLEVLAVLKPADAKPDDFVFSVDGHPMDDRDILRRFVRPVAKQLGFYHEGFGWRTFRRFNITAIQEGPEGVNVFEAMAQAGHTKPETTMKYTVTGSANREKAIRHLQTRVLPWIVRDEVRESEERKAS